MPRYFFDTNDGELVVDRIGMDLLDLRHASQKALRRAASYVVDSSKHGQAGATVVTVRDATDTVVIHVRLMCQIELI